MEADELRRIAGKFKVPIGTLEKDYAVTTLLSLISRFPKVSAMVFKGGTAIKKVYFPEARFSEDLDFTCSSDVSKVLISMLRKEIEGGLDVQFTEVKSEYSRLKYGRRISVKYNDFNGHPNSIQVDLRLGEKVLKGAERREVMHFYKVLDKFQMPSMRLEEMMAEKIRATIYSAQPRHLYDTWFLFRKRVPLIRTVVTAKIKSYGEDFDIEKLKASIKEMERTWLIDLQPLLPIVPSFQTVSKSVITKVSKIMK